MGKQRANKPKTKEELMAELRSNSAFILKMKFLREQFWPALLDASTSIEDASTILYGFNTQMMEQFLGFMKEKKVADLGLPNKLDPESPKYQENLKLIEIFSDMDVFTAKEYIEGLKNEIELWKREEMQARSLSTLKVTWLDEI